MTLSCTKQSSAAKLAQALSKDAAKFYIKASLKTMSLIFALISTMFISLNAKASVLLTTSTGKVSAASFAQAPIQIRVDSNAPADTISLLQKAMASWNSRLGKPAFEFAGFCRVPHWSATENCIYGIRKNWIHFNSSIKAHAVTRSYFLHEYGEVFQFHVFINEQANHFSSTSQVGKSNLLEVLTHELGHVLGLGHRRIHPNSIMVLGNSYAGFPARNPAADDVSAVLTHTPVNDYDNASLTDTHIELSLRPFVTGLKNVSSDKGSLPLSKCHLKMINYDCNILRAQNLLALGKFSLALKVLIEAPQQGNPEYYLYRARAQLGVDNKAAAKKDFDAAEAIFPLPHLYFKESLDLDPTLKRIAPNWQMYPAEFNLGDPSAPQIELTNDCRKCSANYRKMLADLTQNTRRVTDWIKSTEQRELLTALVAWAKRGAHSQAIEFGKQQLAAATQKPFPAAELKKARGLLKALKASSERQQMCEVEKALSGIAKHTDCLKLSPIDIATNNLSEDYLGR